MARTAFEEVIDLHLQAPLNQPRHRAFDVDYGVWWCRPVLQFDGEVVPQKRKPSLEWLSAGFTSMVREEGYRQPTVEGFPSEPKEELWVSDHFLHQYLEECESRIAFGTALGKIISDRSLDVHAKIHRVVSDAQIGNRLNARNVDPEEIRKKCAYSAEERAPLTIILPAFPFKEQNEFRCLSPASTPDIGEFALLCRLHCIAMAINQLYRHDVQWLIIGDGTVYEEIFGVESGASRKYTSHLRAVRDTLNLQSTLHFTDLSDVVSAYDRAATSRSEKPFFDLVREIEADLRTVTSNELVKASLMQLAEGMKWNRNWAAFSSAYPECQSDLTQPICDFHGSTVARSEVLNLCAETAVRYAAFNLAMRWTDLLTQFFPHALRATSHPKKGQIGIPRMGSLSPWNGVGIASASPDGRIDVRSEPLYAIQGPGLSKLRRENGGAPIGYCEATFASIYGSAKRT